MSRAIAWPYPIGRAGMPWSGPEKAAWLARQRARRSYAGGVVAPLLAGLPAQAELFQYGILAYTRFGFADYPLYAVRSRAWNADRPVVLVTGGVHGYETSGVHGALQWLAEEFDAQVGKVNVLLLPCVSPWGYETINRWNPDALDPNRQFMPSSPAPESAHAMDCVTALLAARGGRVELHVDLHETTDTDATEFGPAKAARDGVAFDEHDIPDGFYGVGDVDRPAPDFQRAVIDAVRRVTHIAEPDATGCLIGEPLQQPGVIHYAKRSLGLCAGFTDARFVTTTEVYPDSPRVTPAICNDAQVATVRVAIDFLLRS